MYYSMYKIPVYTAYIISCNIYILYTYKLYKYISYIILQSLLHKRMSNLAIQTAPWVQVQVLPAL